MPSAAFRAHAETVIQELGSLQYNREEPFSACILIGNQYKTLLTKCQVPSDDSEYLRSIFREKFVECLSPLITFIEEEIHCQRGRLYLHPLIQVFSHSSILMKKTGWSHPIFKKASAKLHEFVQKELEYIQFRQKFNDRRHLDEAIRGLEKLLAPDGICLNRHYFTKEKYDEYRAELEICRAPPRSRRLQPGRIQSTFSSYIANGKLLEAGKFVVKNDGTFLEARMVRDILRHDLEEITEMIKGDLSHAEKLILLQALSKYAKEFYPVIQHIPCIIKSLRLLCSSLVEQTYVTIIEGQKLQHKLESNAVRMISWLEKNNLLTNTCRQLMTAAEATPGQLKVSTETLELSYEEINSRINEVFLCFPKDQTLRETSKGLKLIAPLLQNKAAILTYSWGQRFKQRLENMETIAFTECFLPILKERDRAANAGANYEGQIVRMEKYLSRCIESQEFISALKPKQLKNWQLTACKIWAQGLTRLKEKTILVEDDIDFILELQKQAPELPCGFTRTRFLQAVDNLSRMASESKEVRPKLAEKLKTIMDWCNELTSIHGCKLQDREQRLIQRIHQNLNGFTGRPHIAAAVTKLLPNEATVCTQIRKPACTQQDLHSTPSEHSRDSGHRIIKQLATSGAVPSQKRPLPLADIAGKLLTVAELEQTLLREASTEAQSDTLLAAAVPTFFLLPVVIVPVPVFYVTVQDPTKTLSTELTRTFNQLASAVNIYQQQYRSNSIDFSAFLYNIQEGIREIYQILSQASYEQSTRAALFNAFQQFLYQDDGGSIADAIEKLLCQHLQEGQVLEYFQLKYMATLLYKLRAQLGLSAPESHVVFEGHPGR
ncbi:hypothetical protein EOPP23_16445 [Endozoicomonas sp. OPT23]|nr:hypothetical protein [Endozoicomonas sp. OPT23]